MNTMKIAVKIAFMAAATIPAAASAQEAGRMLSLDEAVAVTLTENPALKAAGLRGARRTAAAPRGHRSPHAPDQRHGRIRLHGQGHRIRLQRPERPGQRGRGGRTDGARAERADPRRQDSDAPGASEPDDGCRLVPQGAGSEPRIRGRRGDRPDLDGRQDQRREPRRADQREDGRRAGQPDPQRADLGTRGALFRTGPRHAGRRRASAGGGRRAPGISKTPGRSNATA